MSQISAKRVIGGYTLLNVLGRGGMGSVYSARHAERSELVAIKVPSPSIALDPILTQRFQNEYSVASRLNHPHIVRALDFGHDEGTPYLVMEVVIGASLDKLIRSEGALALSRVLSIFSQIADALSFMHKEGLIHRDVKPGNILVSTEGVAKMADLGLIKDVESSVLLTRSRTGLGTIEFTPPEQLDNAKHVGPDADLYSLAASLHHAVTGKVPFGGKSAMQSLKRKLAREFTPLRQLASSVSEDLERLVARSLDPDPKVRPQTADEFRACLLAEIAKVPVAPSPTTNVLDNRRTSRRFGSDFVSKVAAIQQSRPTDAEVKVIDLSTGGACLRTSRRFEVKTLLQLDLVDSRDQSVYHYPIQIRWVKRQDSDWVLGCAFVNSIEEGDLERILHTDLPRTHVSIEIRPTENQ